MTLHGRAAANGSRYCAAVPTLRAGAVGVDIDVVTTLDPTARDELEALLELAQERDDFPNLSDEALFSIDQLGTTLSGVDPSGSPAPESAVLLARNHGTRELVGCAVVARRRDHWDIEMAVHPDHRTIDPRHPGAATPRNPGPSTGGAIDAIEGVLGALLDMAIAEAAERGGAAIQVWGRNADHDLDAAMAARRLEKTRELLQLRAPLPPDAARDAAFPPVAIRPFRPGHDERSWLEVNNRAFREHPEQSAWTLDDLARREREPWFDPRGFLLHEADGRLAAFCWTKVHRRPAFGEIYVIGVDPDFQGRGLGRALTRAGLGHLAARGISTAMLYVEVTNAPALVLYRSLGFTEHHREALYTGELHIEGRPAPPPASAQVPGS